MSRRHGTQLWKNLRRQAKERDGFKCVQCGDTRSLEVDHIVPTSKGGAFDDLDNLQTLCVLCHVAKTHTEGTFTATRSRRWLNKMRELGGVET